MEQWILTTSLHTWVIDTPWAWPLFETLHFFGLSLMLGALFVVDLRLVGLFRGLSIQRTLQLLPWASFGFGINLFTGLMFLMGDPERYFSHTGFRIKMLLIVLAGINVLWFVLRIGGPLQTWPGHSNTPLEAKLIGVLSLVLWFGVLIMGRLIPYVSTG